MNIFFLDRSPAECAKMHCDKHVVKMIVESAQLLCTALREHGNTSDTLYKSTHKNHPSAIWTRSSRVQYRYVLDLFDELCAEYSRRYSKIHASTRLTSELKLGQNLIPDGDWVDPPQCMPDDCKQYDTVEAYRRYYLIHKAYFARWKNGNTPDWWKNP